MRKTLLFARLDFLTIQPFLTVKGLLVILFAVLITGFSTQDPSLLIGMMMMYGVIFASYPFAVGDKNGIDTLYATLPMQKRNIVVGRYLFSFGLTLCCCIFSLLIAVVFLALSKTMIMTDIFLVAIICYVISTILIAIQLPIYFKFGYAKSKFLAYVPILLFPLIVACVGLIVGKDNTFQFFLDLSAWISANVLWSIAFGVVLWLLLLVGSMRLSYRWYVSREF